MKFGKVASLCKAKKSIVICTAPQGEQWISVGGGIYRMSGMPPMTKDTALVMLDVPLEKRLSWYCAENDLPTSDIDFGDDSPRDRDVEREPINVQWYDDEFAFFRDGATIHAVRMELLKPVLGENDDYLTFHGWETNLGRFVLAVKAAMDLKAIILPHILIKAEDAALSDGGGAFFRSLENIAQFYRHMPIGCGERKRNQRENSETLEEQGGTQIGFGDAEASDSEEA
jgi:hypothetical protein